MEEAIKARWIRVVRTTNRSADGSVQQHFLEMVWEREVANEVSAESTIVGQPPQPYRMAA